MSTTTTLPRDVAAPGGVEREAAFEEVLRVLEERRDEFSEHRYVPKDFVTLLKRAGIYRASTPEQFGGEPMSPPEFLERIERISTVDPSTGWVASFGSSLVYFSALPIESQRAIYAGGPDICYAGGLFPMQEAERVDGGYICTGVWQFASGCRGADILGVGLVGGEETQGKPLTALVDPNDVEIVENWNVAGMRGTGSHAIKVNGLFVPESRTFVRGGDSNIDEPLNRYPALAYAAQVLSVVALGAARGALDYCHEAGGTKTSIVGGGAKALRASYQESLARAEAKLGAARAFFYEATRAVWAQSLVDQDISKQDTARLRLATTHAAHQAREVILTAFDLAGTGAIYESHPLQRYLQDGLVPAQHAMLQTNTYEAAGAIMLGLDAPMPSFP
ncbi:acyl-CoA dehydrogenase family protein [Kocuria sp. cx-455]|uniref:acyl-CoA dehydrogenase family protein n=1 Tax=Kocuria sp. cx-455 TaxID=2771377 RepID=UPI003D70FE99